MSEFKRTILAAETSDKVVGCLQQRLIDLIDLNLQLKQAHWCVVGNNFRAVHMQLDEILEDTRAASDEVAERIAALGIAPDGRSATVARRTKLPEIAETFASAADTVTIVADRLQVTIAGLRDSIGKLGDLDPISEDMLITVSASLEKHLWMVQSQEVS